MKQTVWYLVCDGGDGSSHVEFYLSEAKARSLCGYDSEDFDDSYTTNEGGPGSFEVYGETNIRFRD